MTASPIPKPPVQLLPFIQALGMDGTVAFLLEFGGSSISVARRPQDRGEVTRLIGREAAEALGAMELPARIPLAKPWLAAYFHAQGMPVSRIARRLHVTDVSVRRYLRSFSGTERRK